MRPLDLTNQRFGRLLAIRRVESDSRGQSKWVVHCDCGQTRIVHGTNLQQGYSTSCGCITRVRLHQNKYNATHQLRHLPEYPIWIGMKRRCRSRSPEVWKYYGGRGISVCQDWQTSFEIFFKDMGPRPSPDHSIDRIDNNGPYSPTNCRWATNKEQKRNCTNSRILEYQGKRQCVAAWADEVGIPISILRHRLSANWAISRLLTTSIASRSKRNRNIKITDIPK